MSAIFLASVCAVACSSPAPPPSEAPDALAVAEPASQGSAPLHPSRFSQARAWADLAALAAIGERRAGTSAAEKARNYIVDAVEGFAAEVAFITSPLGVDGAQGTVQHVKAVLQGASGDVIMLLAHYDSLGDGLGANHGGSGPALMLELGRVLGAERRPYTIWLVFVEGDGLLVDGRLTLAGTRGFLSRSTPDRVRLALSFGGVADADLRIARDLRSHRAYRELVWRAARDRAEDAAFPPDAPFEQVLGGHIPLIEAGVKRTVALLDPRYGAGDVPGELWGTRGDTLAACSAESLGSVGRVSLDAIDRIVAQLEKIDRFAKRPFVEPIEGDHATPGGASAKRSAGEPAATEPVPPDEIEDTER